MVMWAVDTLSYVVYNIGRFVPKTACEVTLRPVGFIVPLSQDSGVDQWCTIVLVVIPQGHHSVC